MMFKKADFILLAVLVVCGIFASVALARTGKDGGEVVPSSQKSAEDQFKEWLEAQTKR